MSMKNSKTMYGLAKALAIEIGPRTFKTYTGYCLTQKEAEDVYRSEGFTNMNTVSRHLDSWVQLNWVNRLNVDENAESVYFFVLDDTKAEDRILHQILVKNHPGLKDRVSQGVLTA